MIDRNDILGVLSDEYSPVRSAHSIFAERAGLLHAGYPDALLHIELLKLIIFDILNIGLVFEIVVIVVIVVIEPELRIIIIDFVIVIVIYIGLLLLLPEADKIRRLAS